MELIREIKDKDIGEKPRKVSKFKERKAVRAILFDNNKNVAIMNVAKFSYHKIPGGGVEQGEDLQEALKREIKEEAGATAKVIRELGRITEERTHYQLKQESLCFIAEVISKGETEYTKKEKAHGFSVSWVPLDKAISLFEADHPEDYGAKFMHLRDLTFLKEARKKL